MSTETIPNPGQPLETAPDPAADSRAREVFQKIKDSPYWAGAMVVSLAMGEAAATKKETEIRDGRRKKLVVMGVGAIAVGKLGWELYKGAKGLRASMDVDYLQPLLGPLPDIDSEAISKPEKGLARLDAEEVIGTAVDFAHDGLEIAANTVLHSPPKVRRRRPPSFQSASPVAATPAPEAFPAIAGPQQPGTPIAA